MRSRKITLTKQEVINAIEAETNLTSGQGWANKTGQSIYDCNVCAVGAVLWTVLPVDKIVEVALHLTTELGFDVSRIPYGETWESYTKKNPLAALSARFELTVHYALVQGSSDKEAIEIAREVCINHVRDYFPPSITFQYNGQASWIDKGDRK